MPPSYHRLEVWREARRLVRCIYAETHRWPAAERYGLTSQARRAAVSIVLNITEGAARQGAREFRHHVAIALASHAELECILLLARDVGFIDGELGELERQLQRTGRLLWRLLRALSQHH